MRVQYGALAVIALLVGGAASEAGVTNVSAVQVPQSAVAGFTANEILIDFEGNLRGQQMILNLTAGSIYQDGLGSNLPSNSGFWPVANSLQYDTYVAIGGRQSDGAKPPATQEVLVVGGAANLEAGAELKFDTAGLNIAWAPGTGVDVPNGTGYITSQITLSNDAQGMFQYFGSTAAGTGDPLIMQGSVVDGAIVFGEDNMAPVVDDALDLIPVVLMNEPNVAMHQFVATDDAPLGELTWAIDGFEYTGDGTNTGEAASIDANGKLSWPANGWAGGQYKFTVSATDAGGLSDTGMVTFDLTVPEPASVALLGLALVGFIGCRRK